MQSATFILSPSLPLVKPRRPSNLTFAARFDPSHIVSYSKPYNLSRSNNGGVYASLPRRSWSLYSSSSSSSPNFKFRLWSELPSVSSDHEREGVQVRASSVPESARENAGSGWGRTLELGLLFGLWSLFNIYVNIYNKQVLKAFHFPVTVTVIQFDVGTVLVLLMWGLNLYKRPKISGQQLAVILPLVVVHTTRELTRSFR